MRSPLGPLWFATLAWMAFSALASAEDNSNSPTLYQTADLSFLLPKSWRTETAPEGSPPGVIFVADGGKAGRMTVARMPAASPINVPTSKLDAMTSPEIAEFRVALVESGLTPVSGAVTMSMEGDTLVESVGFRCRSNTEAPLIVLTTTWRTGGQIVRARLQLSESSLGQMAPVVGGILRSVRFRNASTLGFGGFYRSPAETPTAWIRHDETPTVPPGPKPSRITPIARTEPASSSTIPAVGASENTAQLVHDYRNSLVFIEGGGGAGSGFVCETKDGVFLLTNQHVVAGMPNPQFTRLDGSAITARSGAAAVAHDLMRFATQGEARPLAAMSNVEAEAQIGDDIVVLGNMEGARVIQPLEGKLVGVGPDRVEVTAEFLPGNSGSPIIHVKTGKVLGIATYLMQRRFKELTDSKDAKVRRFGYRLDSVKEWQPLNWQIYQQDKGTMDRVEGMTRDLVQVIRDMEANRLSNSAAYANSSISRAVRDFGTALSKKNLSAPDRSRAIQSFVSTIRLATQSDITQARQNLRYDYFTRALGEESQVREEMYKLFDRISKAR